MNHVTFANGIKNMLTITPSLTGTSEISSKGITNLRESCIRIENMTVNDSDSATEAMIDHLNVMNNLTDGEINYLNKIGVMQWCGFLFKFLMSSGARVKVY